MEHLHPEDAEAQLRAVAAALAPSGVYVCITPNALSGPHDISKHFDPVPTGLHLREYTNAELRRLMRAAGFGRVRGFVRTRSRTLIYPLWIPIALEAVLGRVGVAGRRLARRSALRRALGNRWSPRVRDRSPATRERGWSIERVQIGMRPSAHGQCQALRRIAGATNARSAILRKIRICRLWSCRRRDSNPRHADYDSQLIWLDHREFPARWTRRWTQAHSRAHSIPRVFTDRA